MAMEACRRFHSLVHPRPLVALSLIAAFVLPARTTNADAPIDYTTTVWADKDGLPSSSVTAVAQDRSGYLWVGTAAGLVRFDGYQFSSWTSSERRPLPNLGILDLHGASDGSLWISFSGSSLVGRMREGHLAIYGPRDGLPDGSVQVLFETRDRTIWAAATEGYRDSSMSVGKSSKRGLAHPSQQSRGCSKIAAGTCGLAALQVLFDSAAKPMRFQWKL